MTALRDFFCPPMTDAEFADASRRVQFSNTPWPFCAIIEEPMVQNVLRKASRVQADTAEQERLFRDMSGNQS